MRQKRQEIGRLALRVEGNLWNAYWAPRLDTMNGATLMASVRMTIAMLPGVREAFLTFARDSFDAIAKDALGTTPHWQEPHAAPEHERNERGPSIAELSHQMTRRRRTN